MVLTFNLCATASTVNTADVELAGPATNGSGKTVFNVLSIVTTNELVALKEGNIKEFKLQPCDSSSSMSGGNLAFISSESYVATSSLTRRCSKDWKRCHTNNIVLRLLIKPEE